MPRQHETSPERKYAEQLEAHMDEGGKFNTQNVRTLIGMVKELDDQIRRAKQKAA